jgi:hypothetical protein
MNRPFRPHSASPAYTGFNFGGGPVERFLFPGQPPRGRNPGKQPGPHLPHYAR